MNKIGIDVGGTKIEGVLLDEKFSIIERKRIPTYQEKGYNSILDSIVILLKELERKSNEEAAIGICAPGSISKKTGMIKNSNTQCLIGMPFKEDLEKKIGKKILMENDANCFALAEAKLGAAQEYDFVFGVIMGTGVGGGIIINGNIHRGRTNIAGEWGHHKLRDNGNSCYCGRKGCVETFLSGPALEKRWEQITGKNQSLSSIVKLLNNSKAEQWKAEFLENFGLALANVIDIIDPDVIVLGGGVSNISFLYDEGRDAVYQNVFSDLVDTPIVKNKLGDSAGVFGACLL